MSLDLIIKLEILMGHSLSCPFFMNDSVLFEVLKQTVLK